MPNYLFVSARGREVTLNYSASERPETVKLGRVTYRYQFMPTRGILIPAHMQSEGSSTSNAAGMAADKRYKQSDRHRKDREQSERIYERTKSAKDSLALHLRKELGDQSKVKDKVEKRRKERRDAGMPE